MTSREDLIAWATALPEGAVIAVDYDHGLLTLYHVDGASWHEVGADEPPENPRERGDDDGVEYADPRDEQADRRDR